ncbi:efflux RND transporter periplasmic adaptor subunit [Fulvitalea axinellae]|uniref:efflux RND transporter periplasmic adaptor subunit n=1 Tax=Fulvitalea axinellae TaxID=1182444 RepID=UPI0030CA2ED9
MQIAPAQITNFERRIIGNGKLIAVQSASLEVTGSGVVTVLNVSEGDRIGKGQLVGALDDAEAKLGLAEAERKLEQAKAGLRDFMFARGFEGGLADTAKADPAVVRLGRIEKGYESALTGLARARLALSKTRARAPFSGLVANLNGRMYQRPEAGKPFCRLIDDSAFDLEFSVLESEAPDLSEGMPVKAEAFAFAGKEYTGRVVSVNPLVDENGLVRVRARLRNADGSLREGMNVKVTLTKLMPGLLVVPKSAVVTRSGRSVVFTVSEGRAVWNEVELGPSNSEQQVLAGGKVKSGDRVVVAGNVNLGHQAKVKVRKK